MINICVLLDGPIKNDGRVIRIVRSLSENNPVWLFYFEGKESDQSLFNDNVKLNTYQSRSSWLNTNILFYRKYSFLADKIIEQQIEFNYFYCNDYPLLDISYKMKEYFPLSKLIYDSHEIYVETINQFFPTTGLRSTYGLILIWINKIIHKRKEGYLISKADHVITVCDGLKYYLEDKYDVTNIKVLANCPNQGIGNNRSNIFREQFGINESSTIVLYHGTFNHGRGLEKLVSASELFDDGVELVLIGGGSILDKLKKKVTERGMKNVHFIGTVPYDDIFEYIKSADIGALLIQDYNKSKELSLPNKIFEYMAAGIPTISNLASETEKIINECNCGLIIKDETVENIASMINNAVKNRDELRGFGENGRRYYEQKYHWEKRIKILLDIIN